MFKINRLPYNPSKSKLCVQLVFYLQICFVLLTFNLLLAQELSDPNKKPESIIESEEKSTEKDKKITEESSKKGINIAGMPIIMYQPETSLILGGGTAITIRKQDDKNDGRPDNINGYAIYTLNNQVVINILPDFYFDKEKWELKGAVAYQKYPDTFYGFGNNTSEDDAEDFTTEDFMIQPWLLFRAYKDIRIGTMYNFKTTSVVKIEKNNPQNMRMIQGINGSILSGFGPVLDWDTRNNIFYPSEGSWFQFYYILYRSWLGSDFTYESYTVDIRHYLSLSNTKILAFQIFGTSLNGNIPFNEFARLYYLRGIHGSRFRDRKTVSAQIEYRYSISKGWSGVAFSAIGDVMNRLNDYDISDVKYSVGLGLRFAVNPEEKINLRLDLGLSKYGLYPYFQLSEAF